MSSKLHIVLAYTVQHVAVTFRYKSEVGHQKILFRGSFGTQKPGGARRNAFDIFMKNAANTNVIYFQGRLLALFEAAQPVAMNPYSLKTLGPDLLGGNIKPGASFDFGRPGNRLAGTALLLCWDCFEGYHAGAWGRGGGGGRQWQQSPSFSLGQMGGLGGGGLKSLTPVSNNVVNSYQLLPFWLWSPL